VIIMNKLTVLFAAVIVTTSSTFAQEDSVFVNDSLQISIDEEESYTQLPPEEKSHNIEIVDRSSGAGDSAQFFCRSRFTSALQSSAGYTGGSYPGSVVHSYQRLSYRQAGHFQAGLLFEKDPGEQSFSDFTAFHLMAENAGPFKRIILGDYLVETGQGISLWRGYGYAKGKNVVAPVRRQARLLVPYLSAGEEQYLSGVAGLIGGGPASAMFFVSRRTISGSTDAGGRLKSIYSSGLFRTASEQRARDNSVENLTGFSLRANPGRDAGFGFNWFSSSFSRELRLRSPAIAGNRFSALSVDFSVARERMSACGEWMFSNGEGGGIVSVVVRPVSSLTCVASMRIYRHEWFSLHGCGFGEGSSDADEEGWYLGTTFSPVRIFRVSAFVDRFRFAGSFPGRPFPTGGREWEITVDAIPEKKLRCEVEFNQKITGGGSGHETVRSIIIAGVNNSLSDQLSLGGRIEYLAVVTGPDGGAQTGRMVYGEVCLKPQRSVDADFRMIIFRTDSYDARVTAYERDLDGALALPSLSGDGVKWYLLLTYRISDRLSVQGKYSDLLRDDLRRIGSGADQLPANRDNRLAIQCDIRF
jgi:hypothetical protein